MMRTGRPTRRVTPEDRQFLEALVFWRSVYADRGSHDTEQVISIGTMIERAERRMRLLREQDDLLRRRIAS